MARVTRKSRVATTASDARELYRDLKKFTDERRVASIASRICSLSTDVLVCFATITSVGAAYCTYLKSDGVLSKYVAAALIGPFLMLASGSTSVLMFRLAAWIKTTLETRAASPVVAVERIREVRSESAPLNDSAVLTQDTAIHLPIHTPKDNS